MIKLRPAVSVLVVFAGANLSVAAEQNGSAVCEVLHTLPGTQDTQRVAPLATDDQLARYIADFFMSDSERWQQLALTGAERADVLRQARSHSHAPFEPNCAWITLVRPQHVLTHGLDADCTG